MKINPSLSLRTIFILLFVSNFILAQNTRNNPDSNHGNKFEQLGTILPTPNVYRTASGAPGNQYWQQRADYNIIAYLDEDRKNLKGSETITYHNNSPDDLDYLWLQLDENQHSSINNAGYAMASKIPNTHVTTDQLKATDLPAKDNGFGVKIEKVTDANGKQLPYIINKTMMRIDLPKPLKSKEKIVFKIDWNYNLVDRISMGGRGGYEYFPEDGNSLFTITQWFPRMCVYSDFKGWQHNQFTGRGEFALNFGDYKVSINVPADHIVAATGECQNYESVLTAEQLKRYRQAESSNEPLEIVTLAEAQKAEKSKSKQRKTWIFHADNVRDFAWTSSRKYVWDGMSITLDNGQKVMCMSQYPKESYHLYRKFSTRAVAHTIKTYSDFTVPYPYPVAQSVEASSGMEYPIICFNFGRTEKDGTYSEAIKNGMIGVIIHEVGHNFFPMIINSDERQWSWMDEGLNTYVQFLTEQLWDDKFPSRRGPAYQIVDYMKLPKEQLEPIMVNSENITHFGPNAYAKPATGLNILRETIMGRKLFDDAFKVYSKRWAFRHPEPADFFRTMNDASGENLDWFWRGWFYGTDPVDISIDKVISAKPDFSKKPEPFTEKYTVEKPLLSKFEDITTFRNQLDKNITFYTDTDTGARDFYWRYARGLEKVNTTKQHQISEDYLEKVDATTIEKLKNITAYQIDFSNKGGMVMPIILEFTFEDGTKLNDKVAAQIWRKDENKTSLTYYFTKKLKSIQLDPMLETADIDTSNNFWGEIPAPASKFEVFKQKNGEAVRGAAQGKVNPMQAAGKK